MAKKSRSKSKLNFKKINFKSILFKLRSVALYIWRHTFIYNAVLTVVVALLFWLILSQAFKTYFNCDYLITQSLGVPSVICTGQDFTVTKIPGLDLAMNGPLEFIRRGILWLALIFFIALSGYLTFIINNLKKVVKLITFNKQQWQELFSLLRIFITILFLLNALFFLLIKV